MGVTLFFFLYTENFSRCTLNFFAMLVILVLGSSGKEIDMVTFFGVLAMIVIVILTYRRQPSIAQEEPKVDRFDRAPKYNTDIDIKEMYRKQVDAMLKMDFVETPERREAIRKTNEYLRKKRMQEELNLKKQIEQEKLEEAYLFDQTRHKQESKRLRTG
jgi:hypothetical protein